MVSPNVQLVRSLFLAWERGDFSSAAWANSELEFVIADGLVDGQGYLVRRGACRKF